MATPVEPEEETASRQIPFDRFLRYFLWLGVFGFGGPIATVGYMQRDLVEKRSWLKREDFLNGVALGQVMPGPLAAQVAMWVGFLARGALGALAVAAAFILPSFALVLIVAVLYVRFRGLPVVQALFYGIAPAVMAIIALAAVKLAQLTNQRDPRLWAIFAITLLVTAVTGAEIALVFIAAGLVVVVWDAPPSFLRRGASREVLLPLGVPALSLGTINVGTQGALFLFSLKAGAFIFGSGLAIVPFLREGVVTQHHWLTQHEFLDAVAMGLIGWTFQPKRRCTFRHTVATMLQDSGLSLRIAQSQMGHATERTTHRIYSHTNDEAMQRVAHTMEGIFGDVETGPLTASESV